MANSFGGHPTLGRYLAWASTEGCEVQSGYFGSEAMTRIRSPDKTKSVVVARMPQSERLAPKFVAHLDRRLGLDSPFSKTPPDYENE